MTAHRYTPYYCEENAWWLAREPRFVGRDPEVAVITNAQRTVAMSAQRASPAGEPVIWDYHVVLGARGDDGPEVWDLDCVAGMPLPASAWLDASFDRSAPLALAPRFRVVPAELFVSRFASDRRHMRNPDGTWQAPPPPWPIVGGGAHELERWIDLADPTFGVAIDLPTLRARWRRP